MIFLDTNFIIALSLKNHAKNSRAVEIWGSVENDKKVTSKLVVGEVWNVLNTRLKVNMELMEKVYKFIYTTSTVLNDHYYEKMGVEQLKLYYPERLPFNDCIYMAIMEDLKIKKILSFDKHFDLNKNIERIH